MATFTNKINKYVRSYTDTIKGIVEESCSVVTKTYQVGVVDTIPVTPSIIFLLKDYIGGTKKWLHIKNVSYKLNGVTVTNGVFTLKYNSIVLAGPSLTSIDISGVSGGGSIPLLQLVADISYGEVNSRVITFDYAIEDTLGNIEQYLTTTISLATIQCTTLSNPVITNITTNTHDCGSFIATSHFLTVTLAEGDKLYTRYKNTVRGLGTFAGYAMRQASPGVAGTNPYTVITSMVASDGYKFNTYNPIVPFSSAHTPPWNIVHLRIYLCLNRMYGDNASLANSHTVEFDILNSAGTVIHTVTLIESRPGI